MKILNENNICFIEYNAIYEDIVHITKRNTNNKTLSVYFEKERDIGPSSFAIYNDYILLLNRF